MSAPHDRHDHAPHQHGGSRPPQATQPAPGTPTGGPGGPGAVPPQPGPGRGRGPGRRRAGRSAHGPGGVAERVGDPVIPPGPLPALGTLALAVAFAAAAPLGRFALVVPLLALQAVTAAGWYRLNGMWPARQGIAAAFLAGLTADAALLAVDAGHTATALLGVLGFWMLLVLLLQLRDRGAPEERLYALTAGVTATVLTVLAAGFLAAVEHSPEVVTAGAVAVGAAAVLRAVPLPGPVTAALALAGAAAAGLAAAELVGAEAVRWAGLQGGAAGAVLGALAGGCALVGLRTASYDWPSRFVHLTAGVALPLTLAAPAVYALARLAA
ncbi:MULTISPECIES: hypothetical protein [Streptomyces]|uniref:hypothetical protein n=1 Tax=Streptomyces TaxID=1883 RepID=UPI0022499801|nr:hypothetical protein [Streptomyces sp. JHD 1]MCX2969824.1 hypothetical protein [Streptomyces sp. JHD 1]